MRNSFPSYLIDLSMGSVLGLRTPRTNMMNFIFLIFFNEVVKLLGTPKYIVLDRDAIFYSHFCKTVWSELGAKYVFFDTCTLKQMDELKWQNH
jgi:hypothetical protein